MKKKNLSVSFKVMLVAVISSVMLLAGSVNNHADAYFVFEFKETAYGANCDSVKGWCLIITWKSNSLTAAQVADHYGYGDVALTSQNKVHVIFQDANAIPDSVPIPANYFIGTEASHALGYNSVVILPGTYHVDYSTYTQYGEVTLDAQLTGPITNTPVSSDCFPPAGKKYKALSSFVEAGGVVILLDGMYGFTNCTPPPTTGTTVINSQFTFQGTSSATGPFTATGTCSFNVTKRNAITATQQNEAAEMLSLNISGGTLPPGAMIRESPTKQSLGQTQIDDLGGGQFRISGFFDVFTELSTDGGNTWLPSTAPPAHLVMEDQVTTSVPTLSQWGLIALSGLMLSFGVFFIRNKIA